MKTVIETRVARIAAVSVLDSLEEAGRQRGWGMIAKKVLARSMTVLSACLFVLFAGSPAMGNEELVTLIGEIDVAEYKDDGSPASVAVYDDEWGWVLISNEGKGRELLSHVGDVAEITGTLAETDEDAGGEFLYEITVTSYTIEEPADPEDDPDRDPEA